MKWEFDDDAALKLSALATLGYGVHAVINPSHMQNLYGSDKAGRSEPLTRWFGHSLICDSISTLTVSMTEDATIRTKKNLLKVNGTAWALAAAHTLYNVQEGVQKDDVSYATVAVQATMAAICFWKGFEE